MLNLTRLRVLQEVLARGSFSGAAQSLSYTQSAVSQAIARLEAETGAQLLIRDRRGVRPTAAGAALAAHADAILAQVSAAEADLDAVLGLRGGELRLASFPSAGAALIPEAVARFRALHPGVALSLAEGEPDAIAPRLRAGELDLALLFEFPGGDRRRLAAGLRVVGLFEDPMHVALPGDHPLAGKRALTLADLREEEWVQTAADSPCARHVVRSCLESGFEPQGQLRDRRLRGGPGPRGRRGRGGADSGSGARARASGDRGARAEPRIARGAGCWRLRCRARASHRQRGR